MAVKTGAKIGATAAGSAAGPYGMAIGAAVRKDWRFVVLGRKV